MKRSLKTRDKGEALRRYGAAIAAMERELQERLAGGELRERVELFTEPAVTSDGIDLTAAEKAELLVGPLDEHNPLHQEVYDSIATGKPLAVTWDEAIENWQRERNRTKTRPLAKSTIYSTEKAVRRFRDYATPAQVTKQVIRRWLTDQEQLFSSVTVAANLRLLSSVYQTLVDTDLVEGSNPFKSVRYTARVNRDEEKRAFTDEEMLLVQREVPAIYLMCLTGLRPGEYSSLLSHDIDGDMLVIDDQPSMGEWRPKTDSSYRRVPLPPGFVLDTSARNQKSRIDRYNRDLRLHITDKLVSAHSGRHTFYELSRRASCDQRVIETICGHGKVTGSRSAKNYGGMPDEVLRRESEKVWQFVSNGFRV